MSKELQEQLQENLITYLDGLPNTLVDGICQVVVDTFRESERMKYFEVPVTVVAQGKTLEEAQLNVYKFMPWIQDDGTWNGRLDNQIIDSWSVNDVDNHELEGKMRGFV
jgi:hypothetical protein